jgi:hypothetical protein
MEMVIGQFLGEKMLCIFLEKEVDTAANGLYVKYSLVPHRLQKQTKVCRF